VQSRAVDAARRRAQRSHRLVPRPASLPAGVLMDVARVISYVMWSTAAVLPWIYVALDLSFVREWRAQRRARRTTRAIWARCPEARPTAHEHPPARSAPNGDGWVVPPVVRKFPAPRRTTGGRGVHARC